MKVIIIGKCDHAHRNSILMYLEAKHKEYDVKLIDPMLFEQKPIAYSNIIDIENPDWIFITGVYTMSKEFLVEQQNKGRKILIWFPDSLNENRRQDINNISGAMDIFVCSHYNVTQEFPDVANKVIFMPQYWDSEYYKPTVERNFNWDVAFVGNSFKDDRRAEWLKILQRRYHMKISGSIAGIARRQVYGEQMANIYRSSKIAIDIPWGCFDYGDFDTSDRIYKAMGCGAFYLTYNIKKLGYLFHRGVHLDTYNDTLDDLCYKLDYWLRNDEEREKIAERGQKLVQSKHTLGVRIKEYWNLMQKYNGVKQCVS